MWIENQCLSIETNPKKGKSRRAYAAVRRLVNKRQYHTAVIKNESSEAQTETNAVENKWRKYCGKLFNHEPPEVAGLKDSAVAKEGGEEKTTILRSEIEEAVRRLKRGKSPGIDNLPCELIQAGEN